MPRLRDAGVSAALKLPRRLAIQVMAHAQKLDAGKALRGYLSGTDPTALRFVPGDPPAKPQAGQPVWAWVCPQPTTGAPPLPAGLPRVLTVGLDTKGVLQLRCWEAGGDTLQERDLHIAD